MTHDSDPTLAAELGALFAARNRDDMAPTIGALLAVLERHPDDPAVLYEVGGAYDTAGDETSAVGYYERAMDRGLAGDTLRRCLMQYGSTLRNLERVDESLAVFARARAEFPESESVALFAALTLHAAGRPSAALGSVFELIAERWASDDLERYRASIRGNGEYLRSLD